MNIDQTDLEWMYQQNWDEDVRQDTIMALMAMEEREIANPRAFYGKCYIHKLINQKTKDKQRGLLEEENIQSIEKLFNNRDNHDPFHNNVSTELLENISALSDKLQAVVSRLAAGMTINQIAEELGIPPNTVYQRKFQAKKVLENGTS